MVDQWQSFPILCSLWTDCCCDGIGEFDKAIEDLQVLIKSNGPDTSVHKKSQEELVSANALKVSLFPNPFIFGDITFWFCIYWLWDMKLCALRWVVVEFLHPDRYQNWSFSLSCLDAMGVGEARLRQGNRQLQRSAKVPISFFFPPLFDLFISFTSCSLRRVSAFFAVHRPLYSPLSSFLIYDPYFQGHRRRFQDIGDLFGV